MSSTPGCANSRSRAAIWSREPRNPSLSIMKRLSLWAGALHTTPRRPSGPPMLQRVHKPIKFNARTCKFASACCRLEWRTNENLVCRLSNCRSLRASALHTALGPIFTRVKAIKKARSPATGDLYRRRRYLSTYKTSFTKTVAFIRHQHTTK